MRMRRGLYLQSIILRESSSQCLSKGNSRQYKDDEREKGGGEIINVPSRIFIDRPALNGDIVAPLNEHLNRSLYLCA